MIALGGPTLKPMSRIVAIVSEFVSMIALGGPTLKLYERISVRHASSVSMIALGGPTLKRRHEKVRSYGQEASQ